MPSIQCVGDTNVCGGAILSGDPTVFINGRAVAPVGSPVSSHAPGKPPHTAAVTTANGATSTVFVNGRPVTISGSIDSCGHPRYSTTNLVTIGGA